MEDPMGCHFVLLSNREMFKLNCSASSLFTGGEFDKMHQLQDVDWPLHLQNKQHLKLQTAEFRSTPEEQRRG